jgi:photosystem II stability/assembly factor-like uncharacterized protein
MLFAMQAVFNGMQATDSITAINTTADGSHWIVGRGGLVYMWPPGASSWQAVGGPSKLPGSYTGDLFGVSAVDEYNVWVVGAACFIAKWNGQSWKAAPKAASLSCTEDLLDVSMAHTHLGYAVGKNGRVLKWNGQVWDTEPIVGLITDLNAVSALDEYNVVGGSRV